MTMSVYHNYYKLSRLIRRPMQDFQILNLLFTYCLRYQLSCMDVQSSCVLFLLRLLKNFVCHTKAIKSCP